MSRHAVQFAYPHDCLVGAAVERELAFKHRTDVLLLVRVHFLLARAEDEHHEAPCISTIGMKQHVFTIRRQIDGMLVPLPDEHGAPVRLIAPGWYGVANVKWLSRIHVQRDPFMGKYQSRWYRTMREEKIDGETVWNETAVTHMRLKSIVARVAIIVHRLTQLSPDVPPLPHPREREEVRFAELAHHITAATLGIRCGLPDAQQ